MDTPEFCNRTGISPQKLTVWIMNGVLSAELVDKPHGGYRRELTEAHVQRVRLAKALLGKRIPFSELSRRPELFDAPYVVYDGREARPCKDAGQAIATIAKAKHRCAAVDLNAVRAK